MAFSKTISSKNTPANLTLKSAKAATSPASSISADKIADLDQITGSSFSVPGISQKIINGAGLQDIGRADQIIGSIDRGSASVMDQVGLQAPSLQMPGRFGGGMLGALDPEGFIRANDRTGRLEGAVKGAEMIGWCEKTAYVVRGVGLGTTLASRFMGVPGLAAFVAGQIIGLGGEALAHQCTGKNTLQLTYGHIKDALGFGDMTPEEYEASDEFVGPPAPREGEPQGDMTPEEYEASDEFVGPPAPREGEPQGDMTPEEYEASDEFVGPPRPDGSPNPMNDNYVDPESDKKYGEPIRDYLDKHTKDLSDIITINPLIDPLDESQGQGVYTGPSLGAVAGSNGGTSTGSWNNPYGFGGYSGPSIDAIVFSNGGSSTGTFDPLF